MAFNAINEVSYNGYTFDSRMETISASARPHYDTAQRTITYVVYTFVLKTIVTGASSTCDAEVLAIRRKLLVPGKAFKYTNTGFGTVQVNVDNSSKDVVWGPKPQELSYKSLGVKSCELVWKVEVAIPECANAATSGILMEFNYRLAISQDRAGWTTRTYRGYYVIPQTRQLNGQRTLNESADDYWEKVIPQCPDGFRRESVERELDESKSRMDFTVVDVEMSTNAYPEGVVNCRESHSIMSGDRGFNQWIATLTAEYELAKDSKYEAAYLHFLKLFKQRSENTLRNLKELDANRVGQKLPPLKGFVLPFEFSASEPDIRGRPQANFSIRYMFTTNFIYLMKASSLWLPVNDKFDRWKTSLQNTMFSARGSAGMSFDGGDDVIIDPCLNRKTVILKTDQDQTQRLNSGFPNDFNSECPSEEDSWLHYEIRLEVESDDAVMIHKPLPTSVVHSLTTAPKIRPEQQFPRRDAPSDIVQRRTANSDVIYVCGSALRACYDIPYPILNEIGGRKAVMANREGKEYFRTGVVGTYGHTVIGAVWRHRYVIPSVQKMRSLATVNLTTGGDMLNPRLHSGGVDQPQTINLINSGDRTLSTG